MRYKIFILSLLIMISACFVSAYANEKLDVQVDKATCVITVSGDLGADFSNKRVILYCVMANDNSELITEENTQHSTQLFKIFRQTTTDENGEYLFENLKINATASGKYIFYLSVENGAEKISSEAIFVPTMFEINEFLEAMSSKDADKIYSALEKELVKSKIGIDVPLYEILNDEGRKNVALKISKKTYALVSDVEALINSGSVKEGLYNIKNSQEIDKLLFADLYPELNDYKDMINKENGFAAYKKENPQAASVFEEMDSEMRNELYAGVEEFELNSANDFYDMLSISIINYEFDNVSGYGDVSSILEKYSSTTLKNMDYEKYSLCKYKKEINEDILEENFNSTDALCEFIDSSVKSYNKKGQSEKKPSGGGSGGGKGSGGFGISKMPQVSEAEPVKKPVFNDIAEYDWAKTSIEGLHKKGAISGTGNNEFKPERKVTREEFVKMLLLALDYKIENGSSEFDDVKAEDWFAPYIFSATENGLINGVAEGKFGVGMPITREDAAVLIWRVAGKGQVDTNGFSDGSEVSDYAKDAVKWLKETKIVSGYEDATFRPKNLISRAETAKILWAFYEKQ